MAQEYTIKSWKPWENEDGLVRDAHGNYKGSATFEEFTSEPVDATFKTQPSPGDKKYGTISGYETKRGKTRMGFKSAPRPQDGQQPSSGQKKEWQPRDDNAIRAQFAIKTAVELHNKMQTGTNTEFDYIEETAKRLYAMVDRVKGSTDAPKTIDLEEAQARREAARDAERLRNTFQEDMSYEPQDDPTLGIPF